MNIKECKQIDGSLYDDDYLREYHKQKKEMADMVDFIIEVKEKGSGQEKVALFVDYQTETKFKKPQLLMDNRKNSI